MTLEMSFFKTLPHSSADPLSDPHNRVPEVKGATIFGMCHFVSFCLVLGSPLRESHEPTLACWNICLTPDASTPSEDWIQGTPASPYQRGGQCTAHDKVKNHLIHTSTHQSKIQGYCFQIAFVRWALIGAYSAFSHSHAACYSLGNQGDYNVRKASAQDTPGHFGANLRKHSWNPSCK